MVLEPTLGSTIGVALLGGFATSMLYGVVCSQCYSFFQDRSEQHSYPFVRYPIATLWILITVYTALTLQPLYWYAVSNFGDFSKVLDITWSIRALVVLAAINDTIVRSCFVYRAWILDVHKSWLSFPLVTLVLCLFGVSLSVGVLSFKMKTLQDFESIEGVYYANLAMIVVVDLAIAARLTFLLASMRQNFVKRTDSLLTVMMAYTINTGLITSLVSIASLIAYATMPNNYVFVAVFFPLSPLYINALMASYNAKHWVRDNPVKDVEFFDGSVRIRFMRTTETCISPPDSRRATAC
ncbi:hypothetical protein PsYK624_161710 [Phanerochaete sordida]|uniref:DUF6534 domain-containing protein n=1 Tax=Phanerochaete sordida TaxID=48140 RepID=A0A9P3LLU7_9APHY|nr:hypothetical protein PsYK624_161710 [Phanerochaete sordida]